MEIKKVPAVRTDCYQRNKIEFAKPPADRDHRYAKYYEGPKGVMIHSTGANNPNLKRYVQPDDGDIGVNPNYNDWNRPGLDVCVHAFVGKDKNGDVAVYQILPWKYRAWHCGGTANNTHIAFEICEDGLTDRNYFERTYQTAVELTAELCQEFGLNPAEPGVVISHAEGARLGVASNHADPGHWWGRFGATMTDFRAAVAAKMAEASKSLYRIRKSWADYKSQLGAYTNLDKAKAACPEGYSVFDPAGKPIYSKEVQHNMTKDEVKKLANEAANDAVKQLMSSAGTGDKPAKWAAEAAEWAKTGGLIKGLGDGDYAWARPITRQELAVILYRLQTEKN